MFLSNDRPFSLSQLPDRIFIPQNHDLYGIKQDHLDDIYDTMRRHFKKVKAKYQQGKMTKEQFQANMDLCERWFFAKTNEVVMN